MTSLSGGRKKVRSSDADLEAGDNSTLTSFSTIVIISVLNKLALTCLVTLDFATSPGAYLIVTTISNV